MKRITAFLLFLFLLASGSLALPAVAFELTEEDAKELGAPFPSPITVFREFLGIPWGISDDAFVQKAQEDYGITFDFLEETWYETSYFSADDAPIYLFGHPVSLGASFKGEVGGDKRLAYVWIGFQDVKAAASVVSAWAIADDVFYKLSTQYGEPFAPHIYYCECPIDSIGTIHFFALPIAEQRIDIPRVVETMGEYKYVQAHFDNLYFLFDPSSNAPENPHHLSLELFSPEMKNYSMFLPAGTLLPFEDYESHTSEGIVAPSGNPTPTTAPTTAPTPANRIDIDMLGR